MAPGTAAAAAASVGSLLRTLSSERSAQVHRGGPTIEDLVREEVRPLLKVWLDQHLPPLVERLVRGRSSGVAGRPAVAARRQRPAAPQARLAATPVARCRLERPMLEKSFSPADAEAPLYEAWEQAGAFAAQPGSSAAPFTIMIPPPNVTGSLHVGHALTNTLQDVLIRWRRMQGRDALWQPGTDHAGIATQMVVERQLRDQGTTRQALGRDAFIERVWDWKAESGGAITGQLRRLGASLDWPRERFTMDAGLSDAVREVFVTLHRQGLIYRDRRLVNWDPKFQSAISDLEVESREVKGHLWHIRYPVEGTDAVDHRRHHPAGDHAGRHRDRGASGRCALRGAGRPPRDRAADRPAHPDRGRRLLRPGEGHRRGQDHARARLQRLRGGPPPRLPMPSVLDREARVTLAEIELTAVPGLADPAWTAALAGQDRVAARAAIVAELDRLDLLAARSRTPTRCRTATAPACRSSRC